MTRFHKLKVTLLSAMLFSWMLVVGQAEPPSKIDSKVDSKLIKEGNFTGPTKPVKSDRTAILDYNGAIGDDPKFSVQPKVEGFRVLKDFTGKFVILVTPGDENKGKMIVVIYADNKKNLAPPTPGGPGGKVETLLESYSFMVEGEGNVPVPPTPIPNPPTPIPPKPDDFSKLKYYNDFKAAYLVSPNADALVKLIEIYDEMGNTTFSKRSDAASVLKTITSKKIPDFTTLRKVRDQCQKFLESDIGTNDTDPFDQAKYKQFWIDVTTALKAVKGA